MMEWPDGKRVAVSFAFDVDLELNWSESNRLDPGHLVHMSKGTYGAKQGIPRILNMLDVQGIQATFFVPAYNATVYPEVIREIHRRGHEIANHGLHHFDSMGDDPKLVFEEAERILWELCGVKPTGFRPTEEEFTESLGQLMLERGYYYTSYRGNWDGPHLVEIGEKSVPLVDLMADAFYDDTAYDYYIDSPHARYGIKSAAQQMEIWREEFDGMAEEGGRVMDFIIHPQFIGRACRVNALGELIAYMKSRGAWIATNDAVARWVLQSKGFALPAH